MPFRLTLTRKGLIVIAIPFLFQLIFFLTFGQLLSQTEYLAQREHQLKVVTAHLNWYAVMISGTALSALGYILTSDQEYEKAYTESIKNIGEEMKEFAQIFTEGSEAGHSKSIAENSQKVIAIFSESVDIKKKESSEKAIEHIKQQNIKPLFIAISKDRAEILAEEKRRYKIGPESIAKARTEQRNFITSGIMLNAMIVFVLAYLYSTGITKRLGVLTNNSMRLAKGEPLIATMRGSDEIAYLDQTFHEMAEALDRAHRKEQAVIENMLVGLITIDGKGAIESINPRIQRMFGYSMAELEGQNLMLLFPENQKANEPNSLEYIFKQATGRIGEIDAKRKDGELFPIEISINQFETQDGYRLLANILDVSERKEFERLKREFVATVTHELRTPLTSIKGSLGLIASGALGEVPQKAKNVLSIAERNTMRLMGLINDILDIEKLQSGKIEMQFSNISFNGVIERSIESVKSFSEQYAVTLDYPVTNLRVFGDEDRLVQVLVNLLSNACKFSPKDEKVSVILNESAGWLEVKVIDRGIGIPENYKELVFQKFQQVKSHDPRHQGGTGLGLPICKQIVEQHGGTIGVESQEGKGSTFWFKVPAAKALS